ncbi:MAG: hypothetical protein A2W33_06480 [Chloroflexi bacterium RBG_16_52_11]|nr:MAG: hypothetical protein A2W33_06480 [Chloroflexi bacterium RBG_16_52_11]
MDWSGNVDYDLEITPRKDGQVVLTLVVLLFLVVLVKNAWIGDDAYITFRAVENFVSGYGPVHNIGERVQTFTHPFWMLLISASYFVVNRLLSIQFWAQLYYLVIALSVAISLATVILMASGIARTVLGGILAIAILTLSKAFVDYSTSGLENPLSHLILAIFLLLYFKKSSMNLNKLTLLALLTALAALNRPDLILLCFPALAYAFWRVRDRKQGLLRIALGLTPLVIWEAFSLFYYGFLTPNTAFAKLNTGISLGLLFQQGYLYFLNSLSLDPLTLLVILLVIVVTFVIKEWGYLPFILGIFLYMLYVLRIGGDFMSGRYFSAPLLIAAALLAIYRFQDLKAYAIGFLVVIVVGLASPRPPIQFMADYNEVYGPIGELISETGISDEHLYYHSRLGLLADNRDENYPGSVFAGRKWVRKDNPMGVEITGPLGIFSYIKGPNIHVIDLNGLADPLMARLPIENPEHWRIGHFRHLMPDGYLETLKSGENRIVDQNLARYYDHLALITRGKLFEPVRLRMILEMNLGRYDHLIRSYWKTARSS